MYVRDSWSGEILTLQELADSTNGYWVELHIVESLPEQMSPINHDWQELPVYVVESTGIGYVSETGSSSDAVPLSEYNFYSGIPSYFPDKGIVESTDDITEAGWYFIPGKKNISLHIHSAEGWTNYIRSEAN
jgi:hypothetical protein